MLTTASIGHTGPVSLQRPSGGAGADHDESLTDPAVGQILDLIDRRDRIGVRDAARALVDDAGIDATVAVLSAVQTEVGARWQRGQFTVADEHAATAMVDAALGEAGRAARADVDPADRTRAVVVACVENEWHVLPARMLAEQLHARGWEPVFLGASLPAHDLTGFLSTLQPTAVVLSCSMSMNLPGAIRSVRAAHRAGVPVAIGGAALGNAPHRGRLTGADAVVNHVEALVDVLDAWCAERPPAVVDDHHDDARLPLETRLALVEVAYARVLERVAPLEAAPEPIRARVRRDITRLVDALEAALLVDDTHVMAEFAEWLAVVAHAAELPDGLVPIAVQAVAEAAEQLDAADDDVRAVLDAGLSAGAAS